MSEPSRTARTSPPRAWQRMLSGRRLDLLDPQSGDIEFADIAHGLARVARWNGQTTGDHAFSVAQHTLVVESIASARHPDWPAHWRLAALLHDAPEYVIGDLISPFKAAIGLDYKAFEIRLLAAIHRRFSVPWPLPGEVAAAIKHADQTAAYFEATRLAGFTPDEGEHYFGHPGELPLYVSAALAGLKGVSTREAQRDLLGRFQTLERMR